MTLYDNVTEEMEKRGYLLEEVKSFYENYASDDYVVARKDGILMVAKFSYCSCFSIEGETAESIIKALLPVNDDNLNKWIDWANSEKDEQIEFINSLNR